MQSAAEPVGPRGTVTFLFTDIEGSTRLLQQLGPAFPAVLEDQRSLVRRALERWGGHLVDTAGDGFFFAFERARDALSATIDAQRSLGSHEWPEGGAVRVRMGLHTGEPVISGSGYVGLDVHRAARIAAAAHGGQVIASESTRQLIVDDIPEGVALIDLGEHWLKDLVRPERLYQVRADGLSDFFPPLRSARRPYNTNLPPRSMPLIGRDDELIVLRDMLRRNEVRLLTLTGPGGTGKTSLAIEVAQRCAGDFRDGVAYVPLAPIAESSLVFAAIAQTIGVSARADQPVADAVIENLRDRSVLLVLDNFEHVVDAADRVGELVASCPATSVMVTSRFALRLTMEREFPVSPLRTPDAAAAKKASVLRVYPAVELFAQRAMAVTPSFALDDESATAVAEICRRLDGLPLAIELAAARIKLFPPRALLARLSSRLDLLSDGARDLPSRHRTLRQAIGWSYELLEPGEQAVFRRLAVFATSFLLEQAEAVTGAAGQTGLGALEGVAALVNKSLLHQESGDDDEPRFAMLETVREFALEELRRSGEDAATRNAHADVFIALAESAAPELMGPGQQTWLPRLVREHDNMRAAVDWAVRNGDATRALRIAAALGRFWIIRGFHSEGRRRLREILALSSPPDDESLRVRVTAGRQRLREILAMPSSPADETLRLRALSAAAILAYEQADLDEGNAYLEEALERYRVNGDERGIAETLNHLGWVAFLTADVQRAQALTEEALALHEKRGDIRGISLSLTNLGAVAVHNGELERGLDFYERALQLRRQQNDARSIAYGAANLGWALVHVGDLDRAEALGIEAETTLRALGDKQILAFACFVRGEVALERGAAQGAVTYLEEAVALGREIMQGASLGLALGVFAEALVRNGEQARAIECAAEAVALHEHGRTHIWLVVSLRGQGDVLRIAGRPADARRSYLRGLQIAAPRRMRLYACEFLAGLAVVASDTGDHAAAMRLAGAALGLRAEVGAPVTRHTRELERVEAAARADLGEEAAARAREEGSKIGVEQAERLLA